MQFKGDKLSTQFLVLNVNNLGYAAYEGVGKYDFPLIRAQAMNTDLLDAHQLIGFNYALKAKDRHLKGVHFFLHDYQFERVWNYPDRYVELLQQFSYVLSPDFSPYAGTPQATKIFNVYRNRWCGRYWQDHGINVIPTISWGTEDDLEWCLDGIEKHSIVAISTMGMGRWANFMPLKEKWNYIMNTLEPQTVLLYGKDIRQELPTSTDIIYKPIMNRQWVDQEEDGYGI